jgi:hypothetical protein
LSLIWQKPILLEEFRINLVRRNGTTLFKKPRESQHVCGRAGAQKRHFEFVHLNLVCRNTAVAWTELSTGGGYRLRRDLFHRKAIQLISFPARPRVTYQGVVDFGRFSRVTCVVRPSAAARLRRAPLRYAFDVDPFDYAQDRFLATVVQPAATCASRRRG